MKNVSDHKLAVISKEVYQPISPANVSDQRHTSRKYSNMHILGNSYGSKTSGKMNGTIQWQHNYS